MWSARELPSADEKTIRLAIERDSQPLSRSEVFECWRNDFAFRDYFGGLLAGAPFAAFRWETPPVTQATAARDFEFVLIDSPELLKTPDAAAFAEHFAGADSREISEFANLGGDAYLLVPHQVGAAGAYGHLAAFLRGAPEFQQQILWRQIGAAMQRRVGQRPVWLNTAGAGVPWLHVRLDDRPKYYAYGAYRDAVC